MDISPLKSLFSSLMSPNHNGSKLRVDYASSALFPPKNMTIAPIGTTNSTLPTPHTHTHHYPNPFSPLSSLSLPFSPLDLYFLIYIFPSPTPPHPKTILYPHTYLRFLMTNTASPADHIEGIFSNQIIATDKIIQEFQQKNLVLFQAQMQSGKTGCASLVAFKMIHEKMVDSCHLFCGMSDTALKQQWKNDIRTHGTNYLKSLPEKNTELANKFKKLSQNVYFNRDLRHITSIDAIQHSIFLVDEIHYGATAQSALHTVFHKLGLQTILEGNECPELLLNNIYILSITATRANEDSIYHTFPEAQKNWGRVYMEPGIGYKGVIDYYDEGLISNNFKLQSTNRDKIISLLDKYKLLQKSLLLEL